MIRYHRTTFSAGLAGCALLIGSLGTTLSAQRITPADLAAQISGTWTINAELSPQFRPPAPRQGNLRPSGPQTGGQPVLAMVAPVAPQRGGGGGRAGGPAAAADPRTVAGQRALREVQQPLSMFTLAATVDSVTISGAGREHSYVVDNKNHRVDVGDGAELTTKSRWDGRALRQEFVFGETKVSRTYELSSDGNRIEFTLRIDNFSGSPGQQGKGVYDRVRQN